MKKKPFGPKCLLFLATFSLICSTIMMGVVQATLSPVNPVPWPTEKQVNPVEQKIAEFRAEGMTDDQITEELWKFGMGWNPETGKPSKERLIELGGFEDVIADLY